MPADDDLEAMRGLARRAAADDRGRVTVPAPRLPELLAELDDLRRREAERGRRLLGDGGGAF
jgi:hypothetical protein